MFDVIFVGVALAITSLITPYLGLGGGVTLLALLGQILPSEVQSSLDLWVA